MNVIAHRHGQRTITRPSNRDTDSGDRGELVEVGFLLIVEHEYSQRNEHSIHEPVAVRDLDAGKHAREHRRRIADQDEFGSLGYKQAARPIQQVILMLINLLERARLNFACESRRKAENHVSIVFAFAKASGIIRESQATKLKIMMCKGGSASCLGSRNRQSTRIDVRQHGMS